MKRREFISLLGIVAAWPATARAQQRERMRRIAVFISTTPDDPESLSRVGAFLQGLQQLGWSDGQNVRIEYRWGSGDVAKIRKYAAEIVALAPDVVLAIGSPVMTPLQEVTRTLPIVFALVPDPVGAGFVESLARPGGNITGFTQFEYGISGKWVELLKQIAPSVTRAAVIRDPALAAGMAAWGAVQTAAPSFGVAVTPVGVRDPAEIERGLAAFAKGSNGGLIVTGSALSTIHREVIIALAARHKLPAVYPYRFFASGGGLVSYGPDLIEQMRLSAGYVDRILKGEKPASLPVQAPTKYELVINLKTAKALGLEVPAILLARADEVIE